MSVKKTMCNPLDSDLCGLSCLKGRYGPLKKSSKGGWERELVPPNLLAKNIVLAWEWENVPMDKLKLKFE